MTRIELLATLIRQARNNGFEFRKWYTRAIGLPWTGFDQAIAALIDGRRYYALLFAHEFAQAIWKPGSDITFVVPESFFRRRSSKDGTLIEVHRKPYTRRAGRRDVWRYHLQQLALAEEPLRYMRRYIITREHLDQRALDQDLAQDMTQDLARDSAGVSIINNLARASRTHKIHPISIAAVADTSNVAELKKKSRLSL